jgi:hypothetical protein
VASKRVILLSGVVAAEISWMRRMLNALQMVADRLPNGTTFHSAGGQETSQPPLRGLSFFGQCCTKYCGSDVVKLLIQVIRPKAILRCGYQVHCSFFMQ